MVVTENLGSFTKQSDKVKECYRVTPSTQGLHTFIDPFKS